jgi:polysaccharide pyruvyl transferase WcaK-like protein
MKIVIPFGFYGWGNTGDEATLQGFARLLASYDSEATAWVASQDSKHTAKAEPAFNYFKASGFSVRRWWARRRADCAAVVGGTPIMDMLGAWPLSEVVPIVAAEVDDGRPFSFVGIGTERLRRDESRRIIAKELAPRVRHWSVRSVSDRERLMACGVEGSRVTVAADLAWTINRIGAKPRSTELSDLGISAEDVVVGVNVTNERFVTEQAPHLFDSLAHLFDQLIARFAVRVVFFCNEVREDESFDKVASQMVVARMARPERAAIMPNRYRTPQELMELIGACDVAIGMRYHFCLLAAIQGIPFVAIKRSDKIDDLCRDMSWRYGLGLAELNSSVLEAMMGELLTDPSRAVSELRDQVPRMRERAWLNSAALDSLCQLRH